MDRRAEFGPVTIDYDDRVLEPRAWTLAQSRWATDLLASLPAGPVLELCAGAGHIGLAAVAETGRPIVQVDRDAHACELARHNATRAGVTSDVRQGSMETVLRPDERFPLVVADPPWVPAADVDRFPDDPLWAIDGGEDGLDLARLCLTVAAAHTEPGVGLVLLQVGTDEQVEALRAPAASLGLELVDHRVLDRGALALLRRV